MTDLGWCGEVGRYGVISVDDRIFPRAGGATLGVDPRPVPRDLIVDDGVALQGLIADFLERCGIAALATRPAPMRAESRSAV